MDINDAELDAQVIAELEAQNKEGSEVKTELKPEGQESKPDVKPEIKPDVKTEEEKAQEAKTFDENYVKALRAENARYRRQLREEQQRNQGLVNPYQQDNYGYPNQGQNQGQNPQAGYPQGQPIYDPRVDQILAEQEDAKLASKLNEIKADPYFSELFNDTDDEGYTFEERLLEKAIQLQWPISELDALVFKMEREKIVGKVKQKGIDEAYKSMSSKAQNSADKNVSSGKNIAPAEVNSIDDAVNLALKENGIADSSELRLVH